MKKLSLISLLSFLIIATVVTLWSPNEGNENQEVTWQKFMTDPTSKEKVIITEPLPKDLVMLGEKKEVKSKKQNDKAKKRRPSSKKKEVRYETYQKREIIGTTKKKIASLKKINRPETKWKENLARNILRGRDSKDVSVFIKKEKSFIRKERDGIRYIEQVVVNIKKTNQGSTGYRAYIDSETGKVLQTWDRSVHEYGQLKTGHTFKLNL